MAVRLPSPAPSARSSASGARIAYFVHDVNDPAVTRRVRMFQAAGGVPTVMGFRRDDRSPSEIEGAPVIVIGRTSDRALKQRIAAVVAHLVRPAAISRAAAGSDVIVARNLESLALAVRVRRRSGGTRLVYECLDLHSTLVGRKPAHRLIRAIEAALLRSVDLLLVSSPAFLRVHFDHRPTLRAPSLLVENKRLALGEAAPTAPLDPPAFPITIGWFGNLRCRESFRLLRALADQLDGRVRVLIAGRPSPAEFDGFEAEAAAAPHVEYVGPYEASDLARLYARCHFAWAIDYFEAGLNSTWLLPNRLYEAASFGVVPIALRAVETGAWLTERKAGLLLGDEDPAAELRQRLGALSSADHADLRRAVAAIPRDALVAGQAECDRLMRAVEG